MIPAHKTLAKVNKLITAAWIWHKTSSSFNSKVGSIYPTELKISKMLNTKISLKGKVLSSLNFIYIIQINKHPIILNPLLTLLK
jgi:hypothetical protein